MYQINSPPTSRITVTRHSSLLVLQLQESIVFSVLSDRRLLSSTGHSFSTASKTLYSDGLAVCRHRTRIYIRQRENICNTSEYLHLSRSQANFQISDCEIQISIQTLTATVQLQKPQYLHPFHTFVYRENGYKILVRKIPRKQNSEDLGTDGTSKYILNNKNN